mgnify:FL=1
MHARQTTMTERVGQVGRWPTRPNHDVLTIPHRRAERVGFLPRRPSRVRSQIRLSARLTLAVEALATHAPSAHAAPHLAPP